MQRPGHRGGGAHHRGRGVLLEEHLGTASLLRKGSGSAQKGEGDTCRVLDLCEIQPVQLTMGSITEKDFWISPSQGTRKGEGRRGGGPSLQASKRASPMEWLNFLDINVVRGRLILTGECWNVREGWLQQAGRGCVLGSKI